MEINPLIRNMFEIGFGVLLLIGAIFNSLYTFRNGEDFYRSFVENAVVPPARKIVENIVIPRNQVFTILMVIFQVTAAICILSRGPLAEPGLIAGSIFAFGAALFSSSSGMIANLIMSAAMIFLSLSR